MRLENGFAIPSSEPGLGIAWDFDRLDRMHVDGTSHIVAE
jgi:hypothetical protein